MTLLFDIQFTSSLLAVLPPVFPERVPTNKFSEGVRADTESLELSWERRVNFCIYGCKYLLLCLIRRPI